MNRIFNIKRFGRYLKSDIRSCTADYGLSLMLISLMGVIIYIGTILMGLIFNGTWEGPGVGFRLTAFAVCMFVLVVTMPVKCYGKITAKKEGSDWLMVPVAKTEKFLSMVIMTVFIVPVVSAGTYLCLDAITCAIDKTCGESLISSFGSLIVNFFGMTATVYSEAGAVPGLQEFIRQVSNPLLYVDDIIGMCLIFLLGAIVFKTGKTAKTFLAFFLITSVLGLIMTPVITHYFGEFAVQFQTKPQMTGDIFNLGIFRHVALFDTINDTLVNLALMAGIYYRIKTLKH
ncbi:MAG: hypothetical protein J6A22_08890 [Bacteroidales bacterium]|nr:hypothetical protein [Bacteroidales bacterium]